MAKVVLVSLAEDRLTFSRPDTMFAATVPAGPDIAALAVAPPVLVTAAHVAALPDLRIVAAASAGHDHIDVAAVTAAGGCVTHTPGHCDVEVADHAIAMAGALLRRLHAADAMVRGGVWSSRAVGARRITGSAIGVVGLGRIGALVALRAAALGMQTKGIIDAAALASMRAGSYLSPRRRSTSSRTAGSAPPRPGGSRPTLRPRPGWTALAIILAAAHARPAALPPPPPPVGRGPLLPAAVRLVNP